MPLVTDRRTWKMRTVEQDTVFELARARELPEIVARLLVLRGVSDPEAAAEHLAPSLMRLHSPRLLPGMDAACRTAVEAANDGEVA